MLGTAVLYRVRKVRPATAFPFTLGVFSGTLITAFLCLALRSMDDEDATVMVREPGAKTEILKVPAAATNLQERKPRAVEPRKLVSYNVVSAREALKTRAYAIHRTWGDEVKDNIDYYVLPSAGEEETNFAHKRKISVVSLGSEHTGLEYDTNVNNFQGVFRTWKDICMKKLKHYQWFVKLKDSVYLRTHNFEKLLSSLNSSEAIFIGHSVVPLGSERDELGLREDESYCLEAGYAISWKTLELLCPVLPTCQEKARSENEDVEVARCIRIHAGINCTAAHEMKELFYQAQGLIAEEELQIGEHHLNPSVKTAILLSPLTEPEHFYHLHYYYSKEHFNTTKLTSKALRAHMIQTAERGAQSNSLLHTTHHQSPPWTKLGVNSPFLPSNLEDVIHCQSFDSQYRYTEAKFYPSHPVSSLVRSDMNEVLKTVLQPSDDTQSDKILVENIFQRIDPQRGLDYFLHVIEKERDGKHNSRFLHALREVEPARVTSLDTANYKTTKVNFVVPTPPVSRGFQRFILSFESSFLARKPPELVGLYVIVYNDGKFRQYDKDLFAVITLLDLYKKKYPEADLRITSTRRPYSRKESIELASKEYPTYELLFLADIHIDFSLQFLERCRMNALENHQVYFPAVFSPYQPAEFYQSRVRFPYATKFQISEAKGGWMHESFHLLCTYNYDLVKVLELGKELKESDWNLLNLFIQYGKVTVFRSVEPGLVHLWQDGCRDEELGAAVREKYLCQKLQSML